MLTDRCDALFLGGDLSSFKHEHDGNQCDKEWEMEKEKIADYEDRLLQGRIFQSVLYVSHSIRIVNTGTTNLLGSWKCLYFSCFLINSTIQKRHSMNIVRKSRNGMIHLPPTL